MILLLLLMLAAETATPDAVSAAQTEMLGIDAPDEFATGYHARNQAQEMTELVVPPETVETWTKLITLQAFFGAAQRDTAGGLYARWREAMHRGCPGLRDSMIEGTVDGKPALRGKLSCPNNPETRKPENLEAILVQGDADLLMVQVAFRRPVTAADTALIDRIAGSLKICDQRTLSACSKRKATGFQPATRGN